MMVRKQNSNAPPKNPRKNVPSCFFPTGVEVDDLALRLSLCSCAGKQAVTLNNVTLGSKYCYWVRHEHFYSHLDYTYFHFNEFKELLNRAGLQGKLYTQKEWRRIKKAMGKPRRFSQFYVQQEQHKLQKYRQVVRNYLFDQSFPIRNHIKNTDLIDMLSSLTQYNVGQVVVAVHPICGHLHQGTILSTNFPNIIVRFSQSELGVQKISDQYIALEDRFEMKQFDNRFEQFNQQNLYQNGSETRQLQMQNVIQDLDCWAMAFLIKILQRKFALIQHLQQLNQKVQDNPNALDEDFLNLYGWTGIQINLFDSVQKHVMTKFRLRGTAGYQLNQINENLDKLLSVPLAYMERELEQNTDQNNEETRQELKQILTKIQDEKINRDLSQIIQSQIEDKLNEKQKQAFQPLISSLIGILLTLNSTGDINLKNNQFLQQLANQLDKKSYCDINETIISILNK